MMKIRLSIACVLTVLLCAMSAHAQRSGVQARPDFFPLRVGDSWTYRHSEGGSEFTHKVSGEEKQTDGQVLYLFERLAGATVHDWFSKSQGWVLLHREAYTEHEGLEMKYPTPKQYLKNPLVAGATWNWKGKSVAQTDVEESHKVIGSEMVTVPAGKFRAMKVVSQVKEGEAVKTVTNWYADGVGLIKSWTEAGQIKYGWELIDYSFKKKTPKK